MSEPISINAPRSARAALFLFAVGLVPALAPLPAGAEDGSARPVLAGSIRAEGGSLAPRDDIPDDAAADWYGAFSGSARVSQSADAARFFAALWTGYDAVSGDWKVSLDEAWAELTPAGYFAAKAGRFGVRFGPCLAFNPANALGAKDPFDDRAGKVGLDGAALTAYPLRLPIMGESSASLAVTGALLLPGAASDEARGSETSGPRDLEKSTAHGEMILFLPDLAQTEIGIAGNLRCLDGTAPADERGATGSIRTASGDGMKIEPGPESARDLGAWLSADIAGFVIGLEGALRTEEWGGAASVNRRAGDWLAVLEGSYMSGREAWRGFARLAWIGENAEVALSALGDFRSEAARAALEASRNVADFLVLEAKASWNYRPKRWATEIPEEYSAGVAVEYFY